MIYRTAVDGEEMPKAYEDDRDYMVVSYARADGRVAQTIIRALDDAGYRVWYDRGIEAGTPYPDRIADRIHDCACVVALFSCSSVASKWCKDEVGYALKLNKKILPVYLEDVELPRALEMRLGRVQALFWHKYDSDDEFNKALFAVKMLDACLTEEGKKSRGVKPRDDEASQAGTTPQVDATADAKDDAGENTLTSSSRQERGGDDGSENEDPRPFNLTRAAKIVIVIGILVVSVMGYAIWNWRQTSIIGGTGTTGHITIIDVKKTSGDDGLDGESVVETKSVVETEAVPGVPVRDKLDDYKWDELKALSKAIAGARFNEDWMELAKQYHLVDEDGKLQGDEKVFTLDDGTKTSIRILGFRHDELVGGGRAGITFEFADVPDVHCMNGEWTNEGGWEMSKMREWLNSEFLGRLPPGLQSSIETARKKTNNVGQVESEDDTSVVSSTDDRLWLLSVSEVYGGMSPWMYSSATYDAEGEQYRLYADAGVTTQNHGFCQKRGADSWWWLRSPYAGDTNRFRFVRGGGDWNWHGNADGEWGVSPGFCF